MGVTYKAFDINLRCPVTLKVIAEKYLGDEAARLRFLREARAAASVRHPNVASVFHLGKRGPDYFYAMEFVEGETLQNLIKRLGRLEIRLALEIVQQLGAGLSAIHKQKLVHRDIKPSNVIVSFDERAAVTAKIIDLGLAKTTNDAASQTTISTPGRLLGRPNSPARSNLPASESTFVRTCARWAWFFGRWRQAERLSEVPLLSLCISINTRHYRSKSSKLSPNRSLPSSRRSSRKTLGGVFRLPLSFWS
jgi:serine/threonine protein kinase